MALVDILMRQILLLKLPCAQHKPMPPARSQTAFAHYKMLLGAEGIGKPAVLTSPSQEIITQQRTALGRNPSRFTGGLPLEALGHLVADITY